jgi:hypothetical protein
MVSGVVKSLPAEVRRYVFRFPHLDTVLQVDVLDDAVTIRASRNTFSKRRKISFVRELVAEGFIPDEFQWSSLPDAEPDYPIQWLVDRSRFEIVEQASLSKGVALRLFAGTALMVAVLLATLFTGHLGNVRVAASGQQRHDFPARQVAADPQP